MKRNLISKLFVCLVIPLISFHLTILANAEDPLIKDLFPDNNLANAIAKTLGIDDTTTINELETIEPLEI